MPFLPKKNPRRARRRPSTRGLEASNHPVWRHPITLRSLVVRSMARTQHFDKFLTFRLILLGSSGICLWSSLGTSFLNILNCFCGWSSKCLGRSRGDPRSPLGPLQRYFGVIQMPLLNMFFTCLLCIVYYVAH